jgi:hypothetical protein
LIEGLGHEKHELLLIEIFDYSELFDHETNQTFNKKG